MRRRFRVSLVLRAALVLAALFPTLVAAGAPPTEARPVTEVVHGAELVDPYRWLEGNAAPELKEPSPELAAEVAAWTDAQNAYTRSVLDNLPGREPFNRRLAELYRVDTIGAPTVRGKLYFNTERHGEEAQPVLYVRQGHDGEPRALLDPNTLDESGLTTMQWFTPSPDGEIVAFGLYKSGDENATLYLARTSDGEWLADEIPGKVGNVAWLPDSSGFFYRRLGDVANPYSGQIRFHKVGRHPRQDPLIFEQYKEGPLATTWGPNHYTNSEARWLVISYATGTDSNDVWVYDAEEWLRSGELKRIDVVLGEKASSRPLLVGDTLFLHTTLDAPNGRVVAVDLHHPEREKWREIVAERDFPIRGVSQARERLVVNYLQDASTRIEVFGLDGTSQGEVELPGLGSARLRTEEGATEAFLSFSSFNDPSSIYRCDLADGSRALWARPDVPVDPTLFEVEQVFYSSKDGTRIPMFVVSKKGTKGVRPTLLTGYGGFNISRTPFFSSRTVAWVEAGGVLAVANLRGGGEYGEAWHRAGMREYKQNVFDDFIAAGEWLIEKGYTRREKLGIYGGSNGGLLTGAAVVQRPDLFSAVLVGVPLLDMLRYQHFLMARFWVPEYGTAEDAADFQFLREYSPYQNVKPGTKYPAILLTAGENDARVHPLHARKMTARLQAATKSDPAAEPVLLWVEREAGHGAGKPMELRVRDTTDQLIFFAWQLGLEHGPEVSKSDGPLG